MIDTAVHIIVGLLALNLFVTAVKKDGFGDDSDLRNEKGKITKRSGVSIITDYKTGVQYLFLPFAGMTPRLDTEGKPVIHPDYLPAQEDSAK